MRELIFWDLFRYTVEGRPHPASAVLHEGKPIFCARPIPDGALPDLKLLAEFLRSDVPIPSEIRHWLADMVDTDAYSEFQFKRLSKRRRGRKAKDATVYMEIARYVQSLTQTGETRQRAIGKAEAKFMIKRSTVEAALKATKLADEAQARWNLEQDTITDRACFD